MKLKIGKTNVIGDETETDPSNFLNLTVSGILATALSSVESAATLVLGTNSASITGTVTIERITKTNFLSGSIIYLRFESSLILKHEIGGVHQMHLRDGIDYTVQARTVMSFGLFFNSVNPEWYEISRSEPGT